MRSVNFDSKKFKKVEDEEMKERRKREEMLEGKKRLLLNMFIDHDELARQTDNHNARILKQSASSGNVITLPPASTSASSAAAAAAFTQPKSSADQQFKAEINRHVDFNTKQREKLNSLIAALATLNPSAADQHRNNSVMSNDFLNTHFSSMMASKEQQHHQPFASKQLQQQSTTSRSQFSRIFSKTYFKIDHVESLRSKDLYDPSSIESQIEHIKQSIITSDENMQYEQERTGSLNHQLYELQKSNIHMQQKITALHALIDSASHRFTDTERIEFLAKQKQNIQTMQLNSIRDVLTSQESSRQAMLSRQEEQRDKERLECQQDQERTGQLFIRIDEAKAQHEKTEAELKEVLEQERRILKKRMESNDVIKHIEFFQTFYEIFLVDQTKVNTDKIKEIVSQNEAEAAAAAAAVAEDMFFLHRSRIHEDNSNNPNSHTGSPQAKSQTVISERTSEAVEVERSTLMRAIKNVSSMYPLGLSTECVDKVLLVLGELKYNQETNNELYESLLKEKTNLTQQLLSLSESLNELQMNNPYVKAMQSDANEELRYEAIEEAFDAGILRISVPKYQPTITGAGESVAKRLAQFTTVNIMKHVEDPDFSSQIKGISEHKNFFFNFFMSFGDSILRICRTIKTIYKTILQNPPSPAMTKKCAETILYIKTIWGEKKVPQQSQLHSDDNSNNTSHLYVSRSSQPQQKSRNSLESALDEDLLAVASEQPRKSSKQLSQIHLQVQFKQYQKQVLQSKFSIEVITELFQSVFGETNEDDSAKHASQFFISLKSDRLVWFFCSLDLIRTYLLNQFTRSNHSILAGLAASLDNFGELESIAFDECNMKLLEMKRLFAALLEQMRSENMEIKASLLEYKSTHSQFHIASVESNVAIPQAGGMHQPDAHQSQKITLAIENAIRRQMEYLYSIGNDKDEQLWQQQQLPSLTASTSVQAGGAASSSSSNNLMSNNGNNANNNHLNNNNSNAYHHFHQPSALDNNHSNADSNSFQEVVNYIQSIPSAKPKYMLMPDLMKPPTAVATAAGAIDDKKKQQNNQKSLQHARFSTPSLGGEPQQSGTTGGIGGGQSTLAANATNNASSAVTALQSTQESSMNVNLIGSQAATTNGQGGPAGILKRRSNNNIVKLKNQLDYKSIYDINEDMYIDEEARKQKQREKQLIAEQQQREKATKDQVTAEASKNARTKAIENLNNHLYTLSHQQQALSAPSTLREFSVNQRILSKIDRLSKNGDSNMSVHSNQIASKIKEEQNALFQTMVKQSQMFHNDSDASSSIAEGQYNINIDTDPNDDRKSKALYTQSNSYLKSTSSQDQRKKAALITIRELQLARAKSSILPFAKSDSAASKISSAENNHSNKAVLDTYHLPNAFLPTSSSVHNRLSSKHTAVGNSTLESRDSTNERMLSISSSQHQLTSAKKLNHRVASRKLQSQSDFIPPARMTYTTHASTKSFQQQQQLQYLPSHRQQQSNFMDFPFFTSSSTSRNSNTQSYINPAYLTMYTPTGILASHNKQSSLDMNQYNL